MTEPLELGFRHDVRIIPRAPFLFDATVHKPDHFPSDDNRWELGTRWQTMRWPAYSPQGRALGLTLRNAGTVEGPAVDLTVWSAELLDPPFLDGVLQELAYRYDWQLDLEPFYARFASHPRLCEILARWRGLRPINFGSLYEYLVIATVLQNTIVRRSVSMMRTLLEKYGTLVAYDGQQLHCFGTIERMGQVSEEELRALKFGYRAKTIVRLTQAFVGGQIDELALRQCSHEEQRQTLLALYGIGPASVGYVLGDVFHQLDEMQHISPWEQKIYSRLFFQVDPEDPVPVPKLLAFFEEHFAGYRNLAVHYIWEDLFWRRKNEPVPWLEKLIRL
jgi:3-methyladenine DNA glycosylase/8-oxoguanine DNA glycosylase